MKVLLLADPTSIHTARWVNALQKEKVDIYLFGLNPLDAGLYDNKPPFKTFNLPLWIKNKKEASLSKSIYLLSLTKVKRFIREIQPDIIHAHYLSSYGLIGALTGFHPFIISAWGSDIFYVPRKNAVQKKLIQFSLQKADLIFSTSNFMANQIRNFTNKNIEITPFGIDTHKFQPFHSGENKDDGQFIIGTTKALEDKYGIDYLIKAFKIVKERVSVPLKLMLVGTGSSENKLKKLTAELGLQKDVIFTGAVSHQEISEYYNKFDIFTALSPENESFGVSVLEALSCEIPVIVSDVGGFKELVTNNQNGLVVKAESISETAEAIIKLLLNKELRNKLALNGRKFVIDNYEWNASVKKMLGLYDKLFENP